MEKRIVANSNDNPHFKLYDFDIIFANNINEIIKTKLYSLVFNFTRINNLKIENMKRQIQRQTLINEKKCQKQRWTAQHHQKTIGELC